MKKYSYFSFAAIVVFYIFSAACSKDDTNTIPEEEVYMTAKVGGRVIDFSSALKARRNQEEGVNLAVVGHTTGETGPGKEWEHIQLAIYDSASEITSQAYRMDVAEGGYSVLVTYGIVKKDGAQVNYAASEQSASPYDSFEIKITSIDEKYVKGTFEGNVQGGSSEAPSVIEVSEGKFSAPLINN